ncbi:bel12-ag transposon polyprotein [Trichonephila clavipes]|nr:bel12-ag transposon polyprotein [Trichonephila clavipes]
MLNMSKQRFETIRLVKIESEFRVHEIRWKFNPPSSPWWGGFWERLIGILKDLLRKNLGCSCLSYEELQTLVCECESVMNSRPLTYISEEQELKTLTPSMFLQDIPLNDVPDLDQIQRTNIVLRWRYIQKVRENLKQRSIWVSFVLQLSKEKIK